VLGGPSRRHLRATAQQQHHRDQADDHEREQGHDHHQQRLRREGPAASAVVDGVNPDIDEPGLRKLATTHRSVNAEIGAHRRRKASQIVIAGVRPGP